MIILLRDWGTEARGSLLACSLRRERRRSADCSSLCRAAELFVAEGDHGVDAHGAVGGDVAGQEGDERGQFGDADEGRGIGRLMLIVDRKRSGFHSAREDAVGVGEARSENPAVSASTWDSQ